MERPARYQHSSLLITFNAYDIGPSCDIISIYLNFPNILIKKLYMALCCHLAANADMSFVLILKLSLSIARAGQETNTTTKVASSDNHNSTTKY